MFCMTKREGVLYVILLLLYLGTIHASNNCTWSTRNMELVSHCPVTYEEREDAAFIKNCEALSLIQTCSKPFQFKYHCVASEKEYVFMEVCAPEVEIRYGSCATFNPQTGQLESHAVKQCANTSRPCPERYVSSDSYLYPFCYGFDDKTADVYDSSYSIIMAVMGSSIVLSFFLGIVCRLCCRKLKILCRSFRNEGIEWKDKGENIFWDPFHESITTERIARHGSYTGRRPYELDKKTEEALNLGSQTRRRPYDLDEGPEGAFLDIGSHTRRRPSDLDEGPEGAFLNIGSHTRRLPYDLDEGPEGAFLNLGSHTRRRPYDLDEGPEGALNFLNIDTDIRRRPYDLDEGPEGAFLNLGSHIRRRPYDLDEGPEGAFLNLGPSSRRRPFELEEGTDDEEEEPEIALHLGQNTRGYIRRSVSEGDIKIKRPLHRGLTKISRRKPEKSKHFYDIQIGRRGK